MKNVLIIGSLLAFTATTAFAQDEMAYNEPAKFVIHKTSKAHPTSPDYMTEQHFITDFPNASNVSWKRDGFEEASFTLNGKEMKAFYDYDDNLIGTTTPASYSDLPAAAQKEIEKFYPGYIPKSVILFDDNEFNDTDMILYGNAFQDEDNYFVEMTNNNKTVVLQVNMEGLVSYFKDISYSNVK